MFLRSKEARESTQTTTCTPKSLLGEGQGVQRPQEAGLRS